TSISDGTFGFHSYTYNNRGFLTKEKLTVYIRDNNGKVSTKKEESLDYSYDENGNILKAGTTSFSYDSTIKDRLDKVNNATIYYSSTNPLNPSSYKNNSYTFEGRRLVKVKKDYGSSYDEITYEYNDEGLRTAKYIYHGFYDDTEEYGEDYKYYYEQDKLITEIGPEARLDFLYDENDELYGFIKDTKDKYYYVRDFMKNILGIIDNKGNLVVQYSYTAYGKYGVQGDLLLDNINPFKYKDYYYDSETRMYYCKSRYYVHEWCRWLNGDNVAYLDTEDINGMNYLVIVEIIQLREWILMEMHGIIG
ncbi:MAG: hypothetical protein K2O05_01175, partial [Anaeroplasmataceae bacterium]|nr:hypothetical protein [Anaeroplasmataceae bacterium]